MPGMTSIQKLLKFLLWHRIGSVLKSLVGHLKRMCAVIAGPVNAGWFWLTGRTLDFPASSVALCAVCLPVVRTGVEIS